MLLNRAIKIRIYPDDEQRHKIDVKLIADTRSIILCFVQKGSWP